MFDTDIRAVLVDQLRSEHSGTDTLVRHEVGICAGKRRVDVAVVNGEFSGYEIKSDFDTLTRLAGQATAYGQVLDRAIIGTTHRHLEHALDSLPHWWGVFMAERISGDVKLEELRAPVLNSDLDPFALAQLLWRDEAMEELRSRDLAKGLSAKARHYVWLVLAEALPLSELKDVVRTRLKERQEWPGGQ